MGLSSGETLLIKLAAPFATSEKLGSQTPSCTRRPLVLGEWEVMKTRTTIGGKILSGSTHPVVAKAASSDWPPRKMDGSGIRMESKAKACRCRRASSQSPMSMMH